MFTKYYEIKTHEVTYDGFTMNSTETAHTKKQLQEKISTIMAECEEAEKDGHKLYAIDIWYHVAADLFGFTIKETHERIFHWDCHKK